ncbi:hypothetical protein BDBG_08846, partial [Blastomyces gilchristii SLH14081]
QGPLIDGRKQKANQPGLFAVIGRECCDHERKTLKRPWLKPDIHSTNSTIPSSAPWQGWYKGVIISCMMICSNSTESAPQKLEDRTCQPSTPESRQQRHCNPLCSDWPSRRGAASALAV